MLNTLSFVSVDFFFAALRLVFTFYLAAATDLIGVYSSRRFLSLSLSLLTFPFVRLVSSCFLFKPPREAWCINERVEGVVKVVFFHNSYCAGLVFHFLWAPVLLVIQCHQGTNAMAMAGKIADKVEQNNALVFITITNHDTLLCTMQWSRFVKMWIKRNHLGILVFWWIARFQHGSTARR